MMDAIFYTALVVMILYTVFSLYGWYCVFVMLDKITTKTGRRHIPIAWKPIPMTLDVIMVVYWIWMIVRCFTN